METVLQNLFFKAVPKKLKVIKQREDGEFLLVDPKDFLWGLVVLNCTAATILKLCDGKRNVGDIVELMLKEFPLVEKNVIIYDVIRTLRNLQRRCIIKFVSSNVKPY